MFLGFSTGDFHSFLDPISKKAIQIVRDLGCNAIQLNCSKIERVAYLNKIDTKDLKNFKHVSLHAPDLVSLNNSQTKNYQPLFITRQNKILDSIPDKNIPIILESVLQNITQAKKEYNYVRTYLANF